MKTIKGKSVFKGTVIGQIYYYQTDLSALRTYHVSDVDAELKRLSDAKKIVVKQLNDIVNQSIDTAGDTGSAILNVYLMIIDDVSYAEDVQNIIRNKRINAESALMMVADRLSTMFENMEDKYMQAKSYDIRDIANRLIDVLLGSDKTIKLDEPYIIMAKELSVSDLMQMDRTKIRGIVVRYGSENSHMAIIARNMGIPTLTGIYVDSSYHGMQAVIDGHNDTFIIEPDDSTCAEYNRKIIEESNKKHALLDLIGKPSITLNGQKIDILANISGVEDMDSVMENDAEGIGLFRTEFLYIGRNTIPTEEEQFNVYKEVVTKMAGKPVVFRTLDVGDDKVPSYELSVRENNPAMGHRGIRISLLKKDIFKTQLRAILRASYYGNVKLMFPMIISLNEVDKIYDLIKETKEELALENIPFSDIKTGVMIETPAAVMISDQLAKRVDFFSIGTNDLTQYTLAIDRSNKGLEEYYDVHHDAILRMIDMVIKSAHDNDIPVSICGELASDDELIEYFIEHQIDELSVSPSFILPIRERIINYKG